MPPLHPEYPSQSDLTSDTQESPSSAQRRGVHEAVKHPATVKVHKIKERRRKRRSYRALVESKLTRLHLVVPLVLLLSLQTSVHMTQAFRLLPRVVRCRRSQTSTRVLSRRRPPCTSFQQPAQSHQFVRSDRIYRQMTSISISTNSSSTSVSTENDKADAFLFHNQHHSLDTMDDWRQHPALHPTLVFPTVIVPKSDIHKLMNAPDWQPYLATRHELIQEHLQHRFKIVRDYEASQQDDNDGIEDLDPANFKLLLLHPDRPLDPALLLSLNATKSDADDKSIRSGPNVSVTFSHSDFTVHYVLSHLLPHAPPTSFESVGHVAHLNLKPHHMPYKNLIGDVLLECLPNQFETVICKDGDVTGPYRTFEFTVVAGKNDTNVQLTESGVQLNFDLQDVYWCSRLSEERQRLLQQFQPQQILADPFCGVGALCLQAAVTKDMTVWANDWNPAATKALQKNAALNRVPKNRLSIECGDAYDFLMDLGLRTDPTNDESVMPDHVVMNFPLEAPCFLGALRWWPVKESSKQTNEKGSPTKGISVPRVHVYTFARADPSTDRSDEDVAVDIVASHLVPSTTSSNDDSMIRRREELNECGCDVFTHTVRDVAPGKTVVCVSFSATATLLRRMQGDFI